MIRDIAERKHTQILLDTQKQALEMVVGGSPHVTTAAGRLQKAGNIRYHRGNITVINRQGLEFAVCDCYQLIKKNFDGGFDT
jgi:hypothetical protein